MQTEVKFFGNTVLISCDGDCSHAWGINWHKPKEEIAPIDPGTYEGDNSKPLPPYPPKRHNKWCARECERSSMIDA